MKFIDVIMASRRREQSAALQERVAAYGLYPPHRNVKAAPSKCPVDFRRKLEKEERDA